ncbi:hypothetical protein O988_01109 [Pseudogymnoascus sp. VKM F-3808]|nr:hypothetical protein O988_01109 [Pseudogymnoascus sp. VKM F-3808]
MDCKVSALSTPTSSIDIYSAFVLYVASMKRNVTLIARHGAQLALLNFLRTTSRTSSRVGLDFLNPSHNIPRCRRFHSTIPTGQNGEGVGHGLVSFFDDTIYAVSTAPGRAGIAIIRVYRALCPSKAIPKPRYATLRTLYEPNPTNSSKLSVLDSDALVLHFPAPNTVTGEEMLELHIHGGPATVKAVLSAISRCKSTSSIRYAEPGEFTRRAFQNNRLDLAQVEALSDTLSAETEQQRRAAVRGNSGALGRTYEGWRQQLLEARGELEALIDFSEDHDFADTDPDLLKNVGAMVENIRASIKVHEEGSRRGEMLRKGIRISMLGPPNAGKSSLLNRIVGREASIVSTEAGTTRDIVEVGLDIEGYLCTFADTAGLRSPSTRIDSDPATIRDRIGEVEEEGIRRAKAKAAESDLIIVMASVESSGDQEGWEIRYDTEALDIATRAEQFAVVVNKTDIIPDTTFAGILQSFKSSLPSVPEDRIIPISCKSDLVSTPSTQDAGNISFLISHLTSSFQSLTTLGDEDLYGVTERQRQLLSRCDEYLSLYESETQEADMAELDFDIVVAAEHLRTAANNLSKLTGRGEGGDVEEVLGVVFEKFCVGK